ncbi:MAG: 30S ribosomal protein S18 [bacterium]
MFKPIRKPSSDKKPSSKGKVCFFCAEKINEIDYKDSDLLRRFSTAQSKIISSKKSGLCAKHQRKLAIAVKRARFMGVVPYTAR